MKENIHPKMVPAKIICGCGNIIETISTRPEIHGSHGATNCAELATAAGIETRIFKEGW
jgi:ribosomal protein L31